MVKDKNGIRIAGMHSMETYLVHVLGWNTHNVGNRYEDFSNDVVQIDLVTFTIISGSH